MFGFIYLISIFFIVGCSNTSSLCKLDQMCDEYQSIADQMKRATQANDFTAIQSITIDIQNLVSRLDSELSSNSCTEQEMLKATNSMMRIAQTLIQ